MNGAKLNGETKKDGAGEEQKTGKQGSFNGKVRLAETQRGRTLTAHLLIRIPGAAQ